MDLEHVEAIAKAIAAAMRHPDPALWAKEVVAFFESHMTQAAQPTPAPVEPPPAPAVVEPTPEPGPAPAP